MALYTTTYPNTVRTISGVASASPDDVVILCDTSGGAVTLTLQEIPNNNWNLLWKLFVIDNSNNASVNNITINAPSGQSINLTSSVVINTNGGGYVFEISGNGKYLATPSSGGGGGGGGVSSVSASSPLSSSGGATPNITITQANGSTNGYLSQTDWNAFNSKGSPIAVVNGAGTTITTSLTSLTFNNQFTLSNVAGAVTTTLTKNFPDVSQFSLPLVSDVDNFSFKSGFEVIPSITPNKANIQFVDTGWQDCLGFEHQASITTVQRPQYRTIGRILYFRGTAIIPLASDLAGTTYVPPSSTLYGYANDPHPYVFQGTSGLVNGCNVLTGASQIYFNLGNSVVDISVPNVLTSGSGSNTGWKLYNRVIPTTAENYVITTLGRAEVELGGFAGALLKFTTYKYVEVVNSGNFNTIGTGRLMTGSVQLGAQSIDWRTTKSSGVPPNSVTHSTNDTPPTDFTAKYPIQPTPAFDYLFDIDGADPFYLGGFSIELDGLMGFPL